METPNELFGYLTAKALENGAFKAAVIDSGSIVTDREFRKACESNACGMFGKCWTCPPDIGDIDELIASLQKYDHVLIYQTVGMLEDSFDFEGMQEAGEKHNRLSAALRKIFSDEKITDVLHLGAGGCRMCKVCAKRTNEPCRHPDLALGSLEAYGIYVSKTAKAAGMKYINGQNTVTYFGAVFFNV